MGYTKVVLLNYRLRVIFLLFQVFTQYLTLILCPSTIFFYFNTGLCCESTTKTLFSYPRNLNVTTGVNRTSIVFSWLILSLLSINQRLLKYCEFKTMKRVAIFPQYIIFHFVKNCISEICFLENWQDLYHNKDNMANNALYTLIIEDIFFSFYQL